MHISTPKKTAVAMAVAGTFVIGVTTEAEADVVNLSWRGAFTFLNVFGGAVTNVATDYLSGYYANGDNNDTTFGAPSYPGNVGPGAIPSGSAYQTAYGWNGARTPASGTMSFDTSTGAGVGTVNPFFFFGDTPGSGIGTNVARYLGVTFVTVDTVGTLVGTMTFNWNGGDHSASIVLDGSGLFDNLGTMIAGGQTSSVSGIGALPATDGINFGTVFTPIYHLLGPAPIATKTLNTGAGCDGLSLATQVNAYSIARNSANVATCTTGMVDDGIGGDPMTGVGIFFESANFDLMSVHLDSFVPTPVPIPPAVWLFGSGLLGLAGVARRRRNR